MSDLSEVLGAFHTATACETSVWVEGPRGIVLEAAAPPLSGDDVRFTPPAADLPAPRAVDTPRGAALVSAVPGPRRAWLRVGPCTEGNAPLGRYQQFLVPVVGQFLQSALEVEHAANELAERYEEINLLYTTSEILGRAVTLEETAPIILREISETVGARRAAILVHDRVTDTLQVVAALGGADLEDASPIAIDDPTSLSASVFRSQHAMIAEDTEFPSPAETLFRKGTTLAVPIMWTAPRGSEPLGVVNLSDRRSGLTFTAGDQKLIAAIATQIGTAIQNARLIRTSLAQQRLVHEMQLAHDLQMKLLPDPSIVANDAQVDARVVPAESVGGDFYNLFRLGSGRTGVMIGDVSGHGYRAALIMALALSASTIHAQATRSAPEPAETLDRLLRSLRDELASTEMFITTFYGVVDPAARTLRYTNAGHPHAFVIGGDGQVVRLGATGPPLGMDERAPGAVTRPWDPGNDLLVLFTDGISDARSRLDTRLGETTVLETLSLHRTEEPRVIADRVFDILRQHMGDTPRRDDLTLVVLRT